MAQQSVSLDAQQRDIIGKKVKTIRAQGVTPAVLYGHGIENVLLSIPTKILEKVYKQAGESTLLDLTVDGKNQRKVIIQDIQYDNVKGNIIHIDLHEVKMTEILTTEIPLKFIGESKAVKELAGVFLANMDHLKVECLPGDLVREIEVDISVLVDFESAIHIKDIKTPKGIEVLDNGDEVVAVATPPRAEEEVAAPPAEGEAAKVAEVAVVEKKKKEEVVEEK